MSVTELNFKKEFLLINFDDILLKHNNPLLNSQEHYISYKQTYISQTKQNYDQYEQLKSQFQELSNKSSTINTTKLFYTYIDEKKYDSILRELKTIVVQQRKLLDNFLLYLKNLNHDYPKIIKQNVEEIKPSKAKSSKTLLSRISLLDSRPKRKMASQ
jgi:hypothetical protein